MLPFNFIRKFYAPAPHQPQLPDEEVNRKYPFFRWRILESTFIGYAMFYLARNNLSVVAQEMNTAFGYSKSTLGDILAITAISYGLGKFILGAVSDRSDPRKFMATGLLLTALCNFAFGSVSNYYAHLALWSMNGFFQAMGWPPCGRSMGHWFSENERGFTFSIWNTAHNVGGGVAGILAAWSVTYYGGWQYAFYVPGAIAMAGSIYLFLRLRDTPQSVGLPPVEVYRNDITSDEEAHGLHEKELSFKELFFDKVLTNKLIWILALANFFAYITRYSMLDWGPSYLRDVKGGQLEDAGFAVFALEFGGIPSTILLGWVSDKLGGRRGMVASLCMIPIFLAFLGILFTPKGYLWIDFTLLTMIGFFVYPVINLIVIAALDITSKKAIGTAAGFIGLFGYIGRMVQAKGFGMMADHYEKLYGKETAWEYIFYVILGCAVAATLLLMLTWKVKPKS